MKHTIIDSGTLYLILGAAFIFGACVYAAKRILRELTVKQLGWISVVTLVTMGAIWFFLVLGSRKHESTQSGPTDVNQPTPSLPQAPD